MSSSATIDPIASLRPAPRQGAWAEPTPPPPPPLPEESAAEHEVASDEGELRTERNAFRLAPAVIAGLLSTLVHTLLFVLLALIALPPAGSDRSLVVFEALPEETPLEGVEIFELEDQSIEVETAEISSDPDLALPSAGLAGAADLEETPWDLDALPAESATGSGLIGMENFVGTEGDGLAELGRTSGTAEFYGVKSQGRRFVFIVDSSRSMNRGKFEAAQAELMRAVGKMKDNQFFYVIFFDRDAYSMFSLQDPEAGPIRATDENRQRLEYWMKTVPMEFGTNPYQAMVKAVEMSPDAIYILSDGKFTDRGRTVRWLAGNNWIDDPVAGDRPKVVINTIGFYRRDGELLLKQLAQKYGGTYRFVPPPR